MDFRIAMLLIAVCTISTRAMAENVYRCGAAYQQLPCGEETPVPVQDPRTPQQQQHRLQTTQRQTAAAQALERSRLQEQKRQSTRKHVADPQRKQRAGTLKKKTPKEPPYFTAQSPANAPPGKAPARNK